MPVEEAKIFTRSGRAVKVEESGTRGALGNYYLCYELTNGKAILITSYADHSCCNTRDKERVKRKDVPKEILKILGKEVDSIETLISNRYQFIELPEKVKGN